MIKLMDSSLRDGGNVNDWRFGERAISGIIKNLVATNIDIVEIGYLKNVEFSNERTLYNNISEAKKNIPEIKGHSEFSLMVQEDKWNWDNLEPCDGTIKHIRVSFHKTDITEGLELCKKFMENGYVCHCNPINIMGYNDKELLELLDRINKVNPAYFTIVDTFGSMTIDDLKRIEAILHNNLNREMKISAHLHENLGLAYSLSQEFISYFESKRDLFVDASLFGIGRIPGNLCQELVVNYLINEKKLDYHIDPIYDAIDDFIVNIKQKNPWGYALPYALSATYNLHRTYPEYLMGKGKLKTKDIKAILASIIPSERVIYNEAYIESLYQKYVGYESDDESTICELNKLFEGKEVLVVAPGKSIVEQKDIIANYINKNPDRIIISVNFNGDYIHPDYRFYTNPKRYGYDTDDIDAERVIATSNLLRDSVQAKYIVNYKRCSTHNGEYCEDSVLMLVKLLVQTGVKSISFIGYDGFASNLSHFDSTLDNQYSKLYNSEIVQKHLSEYAEIVSLEYITRSAYSD